MRSLYLAWLLIALVMSWQTSTAIAMAEQSTSGYGTVIADLADGDGDTPLQTTSLLSLNQIHGPSPLLEPPPERGFAALVFYHAQAPPYA